MTMMKVGERRTEAKDQEPFLFFCFAGLLLTGADKSGWSLLDPRLSLSDLDAGRWRVPHVLDHVESPQQAHR